MSASSTPRPFAGLLLLGGVLLLAACANPAVPPVPANPPTVAERTDAVWYQVGFADNTIGIDRAGKKVVADITAYLMANPGKTATIIGRTDLVGSRDYAMRLSHTRADAVRDALVYGGNISSERVESRWTGDTQRLPTAGGMATAASNRVVDIAIH